MFIYFNSTILDKYSTSVHLPPFKYTLNALLHHQNNCILTRIELHMINMLKNNKHTVQKHNNAHWYKIVIHILSPKLLLSIQSMVNILQNNNRVV